MRLSKNQRLLGAALLILIVAAVIILWPKNEDHINTIGIINYRAATEPTLDGFKVGMADLGFVEGTDIEYIYNGPVDDLDQLPGIANQFVDDKVDLILAISSGSATAAKSATAGSGIPVVFAPVTDPIGLDLVEEVDQPGGNMTGVTNGGSEPRRLEWLLNLSPGIQRVFIPYNPNDPSAAAAFQSAQVAAEELGIEIVPLEALDDAAMIAAANNIPEDVDAIFILPDSLAISHTAEFVNATLARGLPFSSPTAEQVKAGALVSFGIDLYEVGRQAARLADLILKGQDPADLPVEEADFYLVINLKTAEAIGLEIPDDILNQASTLIRE